MGHMRFQDIKPYEDYFWEKNRIDLVNDYVDHIDTDAKSLQMKSGIDITYDQLILAVGSKPNKFGWPGQDLHGVQGLYSFQDLEEIEKNAVDTKHAVIVGGGLIGVELTEMLISRGIEVTFLVRESHFWGSVLSTDESELIGRHIKSHHVDLRFNTELEEIIADSSGRVGSIKTKDGEIIECQVVGLTTGVSPNVEFIKSSHIEVERGIKINEFFETNIPNVYAIGDCAQFNESVNGRRTIEQVWYTGRIMGETVAQTICGNRMAYNPGPWFNSAKFFDIEYQTYGMVYPETQEGESNFYWEHSGEKMCLHVVWDTETGEFKGLNIFGIRLRHDLFDQWLKAKVSVDVVMSELRSANFDPELFRTYEKEIVDQFNKATGRNIELKAKQWWRKLLTK
jgi:NADPH-dependent 2,4-dienoyl-CoA reductase/sulfur reductase-like enzyme